MWFESANEGQKNTFRKLVNDGRIEITTGDEKFYAKNSIFI